MIKNIKKRLKNQRGMTLVELLAVIVILGIISAIAVPSIGGLINKTKEDAAVAEAIQIINAAKLYVTTNPNETLIAGSELEGYLDNVKADSDVFSVSVSEDDGKYTYTLQDHPAETIVGGSDGLTEEELLDYTGANS